MNESLEMFRGKLRLSSEKVKITDSFERKMFESELNFLIVSARRNKIIKNIPITPLIDSLLNTTGKRFGLIIVQSGFTRDKGNYWRQIAKGIGILTMGMYYQTPIKSSSTLHAMVIDHKNKNMAFYNQSVFQDREPTEKQNIVKQLNNIFEKYFWEKQQ